MLNLINNKITQLDSEDTFTGIFSFEDGGWVINSYVYGQKNLLKISISTQVGCNCQCNYCIAGKKFKRNLSFEEMQQQVTTILQEINYTKEKYTKVVIDTCGVGEPFLNWKAVEPFIEYCFKRNFSEFHLHTIGIVYTDIQDRSIKLGVQYPGFNVHVTLTDIDDVKRNSYFMYKNLPYMILRKIVDYANRFKHYTKKQMFINYYITGKETKVDFEIFKKRFKDITLELRCLIPYSDIFTPEYVDNIFEAGDKIVNELKGFVNTINFDKETLYIESCLYKYDNKII